MPRDDAIIFADLIGKSWSSGRVPCPNIDAVLGLSATGTPLFRFVLRRTPQNCVFNFWSTDNTYPTLGVSISFCSAPCESGQKRPLFKSVHTYFRGVIGSNRDRSARCPPLQHSSRPQKVVNIIQTHVRRRPTLIPLCVSLVPHTRGVCAQSKAFGRSSVILTPSLFLITRAAWDCLEVSRVQKTVYRPAKRLCIC